jgi:hypothetical protein
LYLAVWGAGSSKPSRYNVDDKIAARKKTKAIDTFNMRKKVKRNYMTI